MKTLFQRPWSSVNDCGRRRGDLAFAMGVCVCFPAQDQFCVCMRVVELVSLQGPIWVLDPDCVYLHTGTKLAPGTSWWNMQVAGGFASLASQKKQWWTIGKVNFATKSTHWYLDYFETWKMWCVKILVQVSDHCTQLETGEKILRPVPDLVSTLRIWAG